MVRFFLSGILATFLASSATGPLYPQHQVQTSERQPNRDQFFTGVVMAISEDSLTVNRTVLGKNSSTKTFLLTPQTQFEGAKPMVNSQVTVRYVTTEDGDRAVRVILRRSPR
jgi:hypothetical protein